MQRDYDEHRVVHSLANETSREMAVDGVRLKKLLDQELLRDQAAEIEGVAEETPASVRKLIQAASCTVPVIKEGNVDPIQDPASVL